MASDKSTRTITDQPLTPQRGPRSDARPAAARWFIRWSSSVTRWTDRLGACSAGERQGLLDFVVAIEIDRHGRTTLACWIESEAQHETVRAECEVDATVSFDGLLMHIDVRDGDRRIVAVSIDPKRRRLLFARTTLLAEAGLTAGSVDPPRLYLPAAEAASA